MKDPVFIPIKYSFSLKVKRRWAARQPEGKIVPA
jgi:hypothetical protein